MNALLLLAALASAFQATQFGVVPAPPAPMRAAPVELKDLTGSPVRMDGYKGKVVLLDFWATWCGPCNLSTPMLVDLDERYAAKGLVILGINGQESWDTVTDYVSKKGIKYRVAIDDGSVRGRYGVQGFPTFIVVGKDGIVQWRKSGFGPTTPAEVVAAIEAALAR